MSWLDKSINLTILDLIIIASIGGLVVYVTSKIFDSFFNFIGKKYSKQLRKLRRSFKYRSIKEAFKRRKILKSGYDQASYILVLNDEFMRILYPNERKYLKKHKAAHENQRRENAQIYQDINVRSSTPWK